MSKLCDDILNLYKLDVITPTHTTENELSKPDIFFDKKQMLHLQGCQKSKTSFV